MRKKIVHKIAFLFPLFIYMLSLNSYAQKEKDGNKTIISPNVQVNEYTYLINNVTAGDTSIKVKHSSLNQTGKFISSLSAGDLIMIIQMQGASINTTSNDNTFGEILNYNSAGSHEFAEVESIPDTATILVKCPLQYDYSSSGATQIIRVPRYQSLLIISGGWVVAQNWNGSTGGVVAIEVGQNANIQGEIDVSGQGFRGGTAHTPTPAFNSVIYFSNDSAEGGAKGESIAGSELDYLTNGYAFGRGAPANGGGGGNCNNAGGGGGSNISQPIAVGMWNGDGIPDTNTVGWSTAWNLEAANFASNISYGGGRGGYSGSNNDQDALSTLPGDASWGGDSRRNVGGKGGRPLNFSFTDQRLFMGGGGGAGHSDDGNGGIGGRGGGIVYLLCHGSVYGGGTIRANGNNGGYSTNPIISGAAGGGGGGGNIIINAKDTVYNIILIAKGGKGGTEISSTSNAMGPGGGGGGGFIAINNGTPTFNITAGANGSSSSASLSEFLPNGATRGNQGYSSYTLGNRSIKNFLVSFDQDTVYMCSADSIKLIAYNTYYVPKQEIKVDWYDAVIGGNLIRSASDTTDFYVKNISQTTTYYAESCPGSFSRTPITIVVTPSPAFSLSYYSVCNGVYININNIQPDSLGTFIGAGVYYDNGVGGYLINSSVADTGYHDVQYYYANSLCTDTAKATFNVAPVPTITFPVIPPICVGADSVVLPQGTPNPGWFHFDFPNSTYNALNDNNAGTILYPWKLPVGDYLIGYFYTASNSCTNSKYDSIHIISSTPVSQTSYSNLCPYNSPFTLNGGSPAGGTYYINGVSATLFDPAIIGPGNHTVKYEYSANGCTDSANVTVTVYTIPTVMLSIPNSVCSNDPAFNLSGGSPSGGFYFVDGVVTATFDPSTATIGNHTIIYFYSDGNCNDTASKIITVNNVQPVTLGAFNAVCENNAAFNLTGGSPTGGTYYINNVAATSFDPQILGNGNHSIKYVFPASGCQDSSTQNIVVHSLPSTPTVIGSTSFCQGDSTTLVCSNTNVSYVWSNGITNDSIVVNSANTYSVTITDNNNCSNTSPGTVVTINNLPTALITPTGNTSFCQGDSVTLSASGGNTFLWSTSSTNSSLTVYTAGTYSLTVTDNNNCSNTSSINIIVNNKPTVTFNYTPPALCDNGSSVTITGGSPAGGTYNGNSVSGNTFNPSTAGTGTHLITYIYSNGGCSDSSAQSVTVNSAPPIPFITPTGSNPFCEGQSLTLTSSGSGNYLWSNGNTNSSVTVSNNGSVSVTATNANNCSTTSTPLNYSEIIISASATSPYVSGVYQVSNGQSDGSIDLTASGGNTPYSYSWNNNSTTEDISQLAAGTYSVIITDNNGCSTTTSLTLLESPEVVDLEMPQAFSPNNDGKNDLFIIKGIALYPNNTLYIMNRWGNEVFSQSNYSNNWDGKNSNGSNLTEGTYFVIFKDGNGEVKLNGYVELRR